MDQRTDAVIDALLLECLDALEDQGAPAVDAICAAHPELAERLRARLAALGNAGMLTSADALPPRLGPFLIERRLGGGGMGVVYAAVQEPLQRRVALKVVRADQLYFPGAAARFRREVQLVSRLAHASIAPVYSVGEEGGVPYFAMEHLQGATLAEALAQLDHPARSGAELARAVADVVEARDGERPTVEGELFAGSGTDTCLAIGRRLAEALAHAHSRGVLHRDVKPSNVMLTTDGRVLLFDFGLASSDRASRLTASGSRLGSLAYMSPEQARGDGVDERSDVYGLGALLCEALTLRPPYSGTPESVTAALLRGEVPEPLRGQGGLPRDVVTVLQTALDHDPARRYAGAADLGRDLGHVLEHRPIEARPAGPGLRMLRWTQRHPARAAAFALAVLLPLALALQQSLAGRRLGELARSREQAIVELRAESARAEANLEHALEAIDVFVLQLGRDAFQSVPHSDDELVASLRGAQASLERILEQRPDDVLLRSRLLRVLSALGRIRYREGDLLGAEACYRLADAQVAGFDVPARVRMPVLDGLGLLHQAKGEWAAADADFVEALAALEGADSTSGLCDIANLERLRVRSLLALGFEDQAVAAADRAVDAAERALDRARTGLEVFEATLQLGGALARRSLMRTHEAVVGPLPMQADPVSRAAFDRGLVLLLDLADQRPGRSDVAQQAAAICVNATAHRPLPQAESILRQGLALGDRLLRDHPGRLDTLSTVLGLRSNLAHCLVLQGRPAEARPWFEQAVALAEAALAGFPDDSLRLRDAGKLQSNLASVLIDLDQRALACEPAARAAEHLTRLVEVSGATANTLTALAWARVHEGYGRIARREPAAVLALAEAIPPEALDDAVLAVAVAELHAGAADLAEDPASAAPQRTAALDLLERGIDQGFNMGAYLRGAAEWDGLRADPRFGALLARIEGGVE